MYSTSSSVEEYKANVESFLNEKISNLEIQSEKIAFTISARIAQSTVDYWNDENIDKWQRLYSELGYGMNDISSLYNYRMNQVDKRSFYTFQNDSIEKTYTTTALINSIGNHYRFYVNRRNVLWADVVGGTIGGVKWAATLAASGPGGALAGFFVGGLAHAIHSSAGEYLWESLYDHFGWR